MGDLNLDMSKNKRFVGIVHGLATVGAIASVVVTAPVGIPATLAAVAGGAVAAGIGLPTIGTGLAGLLDVPKHGFSASLFGMAVVGFSSTKALFVTPFRSVKKLLSPKADKQAPAAAPKNAEPSNTQSPQLKFNAGEKLEFNAAAKPAADAAPAAPKADNAPKAPKAE